MNTYEVLEECNVGQGSETQPSCHPHMKAIDEFISYETFLRKLLEEPSEKWRNYIEMTGVGHLIHLTV